VTFVPVPGGHHNDLDDFQTYRAAIDQFLKRN
jgi:hypothetical protein